MNLLSIDNVIKDPTEYVTNILNNKFQDFYDGDDLFKNVQPRGGNDEFAKFVLSLFPSYTISLNFVRKSPLNQKEPNYIHKDNMMGDVTCILYLNESAPKTDGATIYDGERIPLCVVYSKFNRMIAFDSDSFYSKNIFKSFGKKNDYRLVQVIFIKEKNEQQGY